MTNNFNQTIISDAHSTILEKGEYEACIIKNFDMSGSNLSGYIFIDCIFEGCNLSLVKLSQTAFRNVTFKGCKLLGLRWDDCQTFLFSVYFEQCTLDMSNFYCVKIKKAIFKGSSLKEVDFTESDLSDALFDDCDFSSTIFDQTNLTNADFRTSRQYIIDPSKNIVKNAKFSWPAASGLLFGFGVKVE